MPTILITGTSRGIGRKLAELYVAAGWEVLAASRAGPRVWGSEDVTMDVSSRESVVEAADRLAGRPIDIVVNNAGIFGDRGCDLGAIDDGRWHEVLDINVMGPTRVAEAFLPHLEAGEQKKLVSVSSRMGSMDQSTGGELVYRSSKAALNAVMKALSVDLADRDFIVTVLHPGWVQSDMGGSAAAISIDESAQGIKKILDGLDKGANGAFLNYDGSPITW